ncbi:hypothetical protein H6P81_017372 [Aristolochia fimbriata]|uniref:Uncharacterized protein n=1 Tax=Aristolochia fimbriata TaxID=158543 RepID=A0AAV7DYA5_ARIFI|nr:hypothetical protein H6P81_017372 [Aristolochia fimbriata]
MYHYVISKLKRSILFVKTYVVKVSEGGGAVPWEGVALLVGMEGVVLVGRQGVLLVGREGVLLVGREGMLLVGREGMLLVGREGDVVGWEGGMLLVGREGGGLKMTPHKPCGKNVQQESLNVRCSSTTPPLTLSNPDLACSEGPSVRQVRIEGSQVPECTDVVSRSKQVHLHLFEDEDEDLVMEPQ